MAPFYSESFTRKWVQLMCAPPRAPRVEGLAREAGVHITTLLRWRREAGKTAAVGNDRDEATTAPRRPEDWKPEERLRAVIEAAGMAESDK